TKDDASRTWHIIDYSCRISWNVSANMTGNSPAVEIKTTTRGIADNDSERFPLIKLLSGRAGRIECEDKKKRNKKIQRNTNLHGSGLSWLEFIKLFRVLPQNHFLVLIT